MEQVDDSEKKWILEEFREKLLREDYGECASLIRRMRDLDVDFSEVQAIFREVSRQTAKV